MLNALLPVLIALPVSPGSTAAPDKVHLAASPAAGTYSRSFETARTTEGGDLSVTMDGREVPKMFLPKIEFETIGTSKVTIDDEHSDGHHRRKIQDASRGFELNMTFGPDSGMDPVEVEASAASPLEGASVRFTEDGGEISADWTEDENTPDDALLEGLVADIHGAALLPEEDVAVGTRWEADAAGLRSVLHASGNLGWRWEDAEEGGFPDDNVSYEGTLDLRLAELIERDGKQLARIELGGNLIETTTRATDLSQVPVADGTATERTVTDYTVEGELFWDIKSGVLHSLDLTGEGDGTQETAKDEGQEGGSYSSTMRHTGTISLKVS